MALADVILDRKPSGRPRFWQAGRQGHEAVVHSLPSRKEQVERDHVVSAGQFIDRVDHMRKSYAASEAMDLVVSLQQDEVQELARQVARAKGRYLATLMEISRVNNRSDAAISELKELRQSYEELEHGLSQIRQMVLDHDLTVEGVR